MEEGRADLPAPRGALHPEAAKAIPIITIVDVFILQSNVDFQGSRAKQAIPCKMLFGIYCFLIITIPFDDTAAHANMPAIEFKPSKGATSVRLTVQKVFVG